MTTPLRRAALLLLALASPTGLLAQQPLAATGDSKPQPVAPADTIPAPRDIPYPGTIRLAVDASDVSQGIFRVHEVVPVSAGPMTLLHPAWLPGTHAPQGEIDKLAGLIITANGQTLPWRRDPVDVHAFHVTVPDGVTALDVSFQFLSAMQGSQGEVVMSPNALALEWISTVLYPAGYFVRQITIAPTATYPAGWKAASALRTADGGRGSGQTITYAPVALDTLADSPVFAGRYFRADELSPDVTLNTFADRPDELNPSGAQLAAHRALATQAVKLFGAQHYSHYDFLFVLSDRIGGFGLEHHRSSEDGAAPTYFLDWDANSYDRDLLAHEFTHSWNGKFRRPADLWTPDYRTPMRNSLLWVYEGQTQFWGNVLAARSGMVSMPDSLDKLAAVAAYYDSQAGRSWRPLVDTTNQEIMSNRHPEPFASWQRPEDYYSEGQLIWTEADALIRERSGGKRSMDDFARRFFGMRDRDWGELTYAFDDVVAALAAVEPYDWATFLHTRVDAVAPHPPLDGVTRGGYRLVFTAEPGKVWEAREKGRELTDLTYSLGLVIGKENMVTDVHWGGPAFKAGIAKGTTLVAANGDAFDTDELKAMITAAKGGTKPISLLIKQGARYRTVDVLWTGGLRYPHLQRTGKGPGSLDRLFQPR